jgi:bacteriocin-like protein
VAEQQGCVKHRLAEATSDNVCIKPKEYTMTHEEGKMRVLTTKELEAVSGGDGGQNVALFNHNSGVFGASGNPNSSAGPGFFLEPQGGPQAVSTAVHFVQGLPI